MGEKERQAWRRAITRVVLQQRRREDVSPILTPLDPEIHDKLEKGDGQLVGEFQHYRWFEKDREELRAVVGGPGTPLHGKYIYVLAPNFNLYVYDEPPGRGGGRDDEFRHSAFLAGRPVLSAGQLFVWNGTVVLIDNSSGHYKPKPGSLGYVLKWLARQVDMREAIVTTQALNGTYSYKALELLKYGPTAPPLKYVPDVENVFKYILDLEEEGVYFSSFADAANSYAYMQQEKIAKVRMRKEEEARQRAQEEQRRQKLEREKQEQQKKVDTTTSARRAARDEARRQMRLDIQRRKQEQSKKSSDDG